MLIKPNSQENTMLKRWRENNMKISIDFRERNRKQRALEYYTEEGHEVIIETLPVGDYVFDNQVVFEYKTMEDFFNSLRNESLFNECANQAREYKYHYIIVSGDVRNYCRNTWNWRRAKYNNNYNRYLVLSMGAYAGALRRLRTFTTPIIVKDEDEAFEEMLQQAKKCLDGLSDQYADITRPVPSNDPAMVLLTSVKGVSSKRAKKIIEYFNIKSINDLLNVRTFLEVPGVGTKTAANIYNFLHKRREP